MTAPTDTTPAIPTSPSTAGSLDAVAQQIASDGLAAARAYTDGRAASAYSRLDRVEQDLAAMRERLDAIGNATPTTPTTPTTPPDPPVLTQPASRWPTTVVKPGSSGVMVNRPGPPDAVKISQRHFTGQGTPGVDGTAIAISVTKPLREVVIEDVDIDNLTGGIAVQSWAKDDPKPEPIDRVVLRRCTIRDIYNAAGTGPMPTRAAGVFTQNVAELILEDCLFERIGYREGLDPRDEFSHGIYANPDMGTTTTRLKRCLFRGMSSHAINADRCELDGVIASDCAICFGVKSLTEATPRDCYALSIDHEVLQGFNVGPRGWAWYSGFPLDQHVQVREDDPIDWAVVDAAQPADRFDVAMGYLNR